MNKLFRIFLSIFILFFFAGCAQVKGFLGKVEDKTSETMPEESPESKPIFSSRPFEVKAHEYEENDELQLALMLMRIAGEISPDDKDIAERITELETRIEYKTNRHFNEGVVLYKKKKFKDARKQFLIVLKNDPDHKEALEYLKYRFVRKGYKEYKVKDKDTLKGISQQFYKDPGKDFLIADLNHIKPNTKLVPGTTLQLPILDPELTKPPFDIDKELTKAKTFLERKAYEDVLRVSGKILEHDRSNKEAVDLKRAAYYQMGLDLGRQKKYTEAISMFKKAGPEYMGVEEAIQEITDKELKKAEKLLKEKQYESAIAVAEKILDYDHTNKSAKNLINTTYCQMGRDLINQKNYVQALDVLNDADPGYGCVKKALADVNEILKKQAEIHYLRGVKHFLNEELNDAIKEWEKTLAIDPGYKKAEESIKKARNLLERLEKVK